MTRLPRSLATAALTLALVVSPLSIPVASAAPTTFSDEFAAGPLNTGAWKTVLPWGTQYNNREQQWYNPGNVSFTGGGVRISTLQQSMNGYPYTSGIITSQKQMSYGYFEFRAKLPKGPGVWPALWLLNDGTQEIDVMELLGQTPNKIYMTYHRNGQQYQATYTLPSGDFSQAYHTFAVDVQPTYIRWYVDGVKRGEYVTAVPSNTGNIIVNTAVGDSTSWPGAPTSATTFPQYLDLDYIRVFATMADAATPPNAAPVGRTDAYVTDQDTPLSVAAPGVLANDTDAEGTALTAVLATQPSHGTVSLNADGSFTYTPAAGYAGPDSFTYKASDGSLASSAVTVQLTVNAAPVVTPPPAGDPGAVTPPPVSDPGTVTPPPAGDPGAVTPPPASDPGTVTLPPVSDPVTASPPPDSDPATVTAPPASDPSTAAPDPNNVPYASDDTYQARTDFTLTVAAPGVLADDGDVDGDALTALLVSAPENGDVTLNADGSFAYAPRPGFSGSDTFSYVVSDGKSLSDVANVTVNVKTRGRSVKWRAQASASSTSFTTLAVAAWRTATGRIQDFWSHLRGYILHRFQ